MDDEQPGLLLAGIAERVPGAAGNQNEPLGADLQVLTLDGDRHQAVEDEVRLRAVHVAVRRRAAAAGRQRALHQREVAAVLLRHGLEEHDAAAGRVTPLPLAALHDPSAHRPNVTADGSGCRARVISRPALTTPAAPKNAMINTRPLRYAASGSPAVA